MKTQLLGWHGKPLVGRSSCLVTAISDRKATPICPGFSYGIKAMLDFHDDLRRKIGENDLM